MSTLYIMKSRLDLSEADIEKAPLFVGLIAFDTGVKMILFYDFIEKS